MTVVRAVLGAIGVLGGFALLGIAVWKLATPDYVAAFLLLLAGIATVRGGAEVLRPVVGE